MTENNRELLGRGTQCVAYRFFRTEEPDLVLKMPYLPFLNSTEGIGGRMMERQVFDLELVTKYFGERLVQGAKVFPRWGKWYISQFYYGEDRPNYQSPQLEQIGPQLREVIERNSQLVADTGFTFDFFGVESWGDIANYLRNPSYWSMPAFRIVETENNPELRMADFGLLWTGLKRPGKGRYIHFHEPFSGWSSVNIVLPLVKQRLGISEKG